MSKMVVNNKIGMQEELSVIDMKPGHTYKVTFSDGSVNNVLACRTDGWHIDIANNERLIVCFENSMAYVVDSGYISHIEHINVEVEITK